MDELLIKRVNKIIKQFKDRPINIKHLREFIFPADQLITKESIKRHLLLKEYISISDDYMYHYKDLTGYCKKYEIKEINAFKRGMYKSYGVSKITLTNLDLKLILDNENIKGNVSPIAYTMKKSLEDLIIVKTLNGIHEIRNREDLIEFGLENTYISFDLLKEYCTIFYGESQFELRYILNDKDIKLTSDKIEFESHRKDAIAKVAEAKGEKKVYDVHLEFEIQDFKNYKSDKIINNYKNANSTTLIVNLRLNEILATFLNISKENKRISYSSSKENYLSKHLREFEKIGLLKKEKKRKSGYIVTEECAGISQKLEHIIKFEPNKNLFMNKNIMTRKNMELLFNHIRNDLILLLNRFGNFRFLLQLIDDMHSLSIYNMNDILKYCVANNYENEFIKIFLGRKGTAGRGAIINGTDICFANIGLVKYSNTRCALCYERYRTNPTNLTEKLLFVRDVIAAEEYSKIEKDNKKLKILAEDPLILKFLVKFGATYYNKNILKALKIIKSDALMKSQGEYCPYIDEWRAYDHEI